MPFLLQLRARSHLGTFRTSLLRWLAIRSLAQARALWEQEQEQGQEQKEREQEQELLQPA